MDLSEKSGSLNGNQWVGGVNPAQFTNDFSKLAIPELAVGKDCA
jgi:hypothetical protein